MEIADTKGDPFAISSAASGASVLGLGLKNTFCILDSNSGIHSDRKEMRVGTNGP